MAEENKRQPRTEEQLKQIAKDIVGNLIFCDRFCHTPEDVPVVFMGLMFIDWDADWAKDFKENAGMIFEYYEKAGPRSVNGMPMFTSLQWLDKAETNKVIEYTAKLREALNSI